MTKSTSSKQSSQAGQPGETWTKPEVMLTGLVQAAVRELFPDADDAQVEELVGRVVNLKAFQETTKEVRKAQNCADREKNSKLKVIQAKKDLKKEKDDCLAEVRETYKSLLCDTVRLSKAVEELTALVASTDNLPQELVTKLREVERVRKTVDGHARKAEDMYDEVSTAIDQVQRRVRALKALIAEKNAELDKAKSACGAGNFGGFGDNRGWTRLPIELRCRFCA